MEDLKIIITKRINDMPLSILQDTIEKLQAYGVCFYNNCGVFNFNKFKKDCIETSKILFENDKPHFQTNIRYQLCDFLSTVQTITGIRNFTKFMHDDSLSARLKEEEETWEKLGWWQDR